MKVLIGAAASALLLASVAMAQTPPAPATPPAAPAVDTLPTQCGVIAPAPTIPDGGNATASQMRTADITYRAWATDTETKLHCRAAEVETAGHQYQTAVAAFQANSANARTVSDTYNTSIAAFNARGAHAHVDDHHSGLVSTH